MKQIATLTFCLLVTLTGYSQSQKKIDEETIREDAYIKTAYPKEVNSCGILPSTLYLSKKRVIFTCPEASFDIKITKRKKSVWYGYDNGIKYQMRTVMKGDAPVLMFLPEAGSQKLAVMISRVNICD